MCSLTTGRRRFLTEPQFSRTSHQFCTSSLWLCQHHLVPPVRSLAVLNGLSWICTHPVPLHAHTHFLAGLRAALILNAGQAVPAPPSVALGVLQNLHHTCLVDGVDALAERQTFRRQDWLGGGHELVHMGECAELRGCIKEADVFCLFFQSFF